ncbi:GntR family transcriptional regulator [Streptomyces sp. ISL-66]|uniref:GntR family transcriptional regulator n=1 Tax=Streptomyces sp. ISL-66 TaxID=2819186 RepID=UPI001BE80888|nr:GntR family transcriptional regulator [Streptomyces sp. ISL-66]MBT2472097.1 GntR family transcriptional regulator [Streptomyces sp. ISL-66]
MNSTHKRDHALIVEAIDADWLDRDRLLVHLARDHGLRVEDVSNYGMVPLSEMHNAAHSKADGILYVAPLQRVADSLAARIRTGEVSAGSSLVVEDIADEFGLDRRQAKHVLGNLRRDGFLSREGNEVLLPEGVS